MPAPAGAHASVSSQVTMHLTNYSLNKRSKDFDHGPHAMPVCERLAALPACVCFVVVLRLRPGRQPGSEEDFSSGSKRTLTAAFKGAITPSRGFSSTHSPAILHATQTWRKRGWTSRSAGSRSGCSLGPRWPPSGTPTSRCPRHCDEIFPHLRHFPHPRSPVLMSACFQESRAREKNKSAKLVNLTGYASHTRPVNASITPIQKVLLLTCVVVSGASASRLWDSTCCSTRRGARTCWR